MTTQQSAIDRLLFVQNLERAGLIPMYFDRHHTAIAGVI